MSIQASVIDDRGILAMKYVLGEEMNVMVPCDLGPEEICSCFEQHISETRRRDPYMLDGEYYDIPGRFLLALLEGLDGSPDRKIIYLDSDRERQFLVTISSEGVCLCHDREKGLFERIEIPEGRSMIQYAFTDGRTRNETPRLPLVREVEFLNSLSRLYPGRIIKPATHDEYARKGGELGEKDFMAALDYHPNENEIAFARDCLRNAVATEHVEDEIMLCRNDYVNAAKVMGACKIGEGVHKIWLLVEALSLRGY
jgi:hypothetical protein